MSKRQRVLLRLEEALASDGLASDSLTWRIPSKYDVLSASSQPASVSQPAAAASATSTVSSATSGSALMPLPPSVLPASAAACASDSTATLPGPPRITLDRCNHEGSRAQQQQPAETSSHPNDRSVHVQGSSTSTSRKRARESYNYDDDSEEVDADFEFDPDNQAASDSELDIGTRERNNYCDDRDSQLDRHGRDIEEEQAYSYSNHDAVAHLSAKQQVRFWRDHWRNFRVAQARRDKDLKRVRFAREARAAAAIATAASDVRGK